MFRGVVYRQYARFGAEANYFASAGVLGEALAEP